MFWSFYRSNLLTEMAGVQFIVDIEAAPLFGQDPLELARRVKLATPTETEVARDTAFLKLPFDDAIQHFADRALVSAEEFDAMLDAQRARAFMMRRAASEEIAANAQRLLADAMQPGGTGLREFITAIQDDTAKLGFTPNSPGYLETVYRTSNATSYNGGRLRGQMSPAVISSGGIWTYLTVKDSRVRPAHAELHGLQWEIGDPEAAAVYPPNGFNCYPGDTKVAGRVLFATRAPYSGEVVKLSTHSGRLLTITPNHPVLTGRGWLTAAEVKEGDDLIGHDIADDRQPVGSVNVQDSPATAEQVWQSLAVRNGSARLRHRAFDFHGDARRFNGDVEIVAADRELWRHLQSSQPERVGDLDLSATNAGDVALVSDGDGDAMRLAPRAPSRGIMRSLDLGHALRSGHARPFEALGVGASPDSLASLRESSVYDRPRDPKVFGEFVDAGSGAVSADKVRRIDVESFHGFVYDLQTDTGWALCNGIVVANCRCSMLVSDREDLDPTLYNQDLGDLEHDPITEGFRGPPDEAIAQEAAGV